MWPIDINVTKTNGVFVVAVHDYANNGKNNNAFNMVRSIPQYAKCYINEFLVTDVITNNMHTLIEAYEQQRSSGNTSIEVSSYALVINGTVIVNDDYTYDTIVFSDEQIATIAAAIKAL